MANKEKQKEFLLKLADLFEEYDMELTINEWSTWGGGGADSVNFYSYPSERWEDHFDVDSPGTRIDAETLRKMADETK